MTFQLPVTEDERWRCITFGWVAIDSDDGYIERSAGRHKAGRPARYYVRPSRATRGFLVTANSDEEAVAKANLKLSKLSEEV